MPVRYKVNVLEALKHKGYSPARLRREKIIGERQIQQLRDGDLVSWLIISRLCELLGCQPGDLVEYVDAE